MKRSGFQSAPKSVFAQKDVKIEVIIVDNKSSDTTLLRAREFDVKIIEIDKYLPGFLGFKLWDCKFQWRNYMLSFRSLRAYR